MRLAEHIAYRVSLYCRLSVGKSTDNIPLERNMEDIIK
jgi:hypothetical protein